MNSASSLLFVHLWMSSKESLTAVMNNIKKTKRAVQLRKSLRAIKLLRSLQNQQAMKAAHDARGHLMRLVTQEQASLPIGLEPGQELGDYDLCLSKEEGVDADPNEQQEEEVVERSSSRSGFNPLWLLGLVLLLLPLCVLCVFIAGRRRRSRRALSSLSASSISFSAKARRQYVGSE